MDIIAEIKSTDAKIRYLNTELKNAEAKMTLAGIQYSGISRSSYKGSALEEKSIDIIDMYDKLKEMILIESKLREKMWIMVEAIPAAEVIDVINCIALKFMTYAKTAEELKMSIRQLRRILSKISEYFNAIYNNPVYMVAVEKAVSENKSLNEILSESDPDLIDFTNAIFEKV